MVARQDTLFNTPSKKKLTKREKKERLKELIRKDDLKKDYEPEKIQELHEKNKREIC